jgi:hypothetical protein
MDTSTFTSRMRLPDYMESGNFPVNGWNFQVHVGYERIELKRWPVSWKRLCPWKTWKAHQFQSNFLCVGVPHPQIESVIVWILAKNQYAHWEPWRCHPLWDPYIRRWYILVLPVLNLPGIQRNHWTEIIPSAACVDCFLFRVPRKDQDWAIYSLLGTFTLGKVPLWEICMNSWLRGGCSIDAD